MGNSDVLCVLLVGLLLVASAEGDLKPSAGEARGAMVAKGGLPTVRFSDCDVWCHNVHPNMNHRLCVQNLCPYDKTPHFSIGEAREAMVANGGLPTVRFSDCDVWCHTFHPNMNHRFCVQIFCPYDKTPHFSAGEATEAMVAKGGMPAVRFSYDKTPKVKLTSDDLLSA